MHQGIHDSEEVNEPANDLHLSTADPHPGSDIPWLKLRSARWLRFASAPTLETHDVLVYRRSDYIHPIQFEGERGQSVEVTPKGRFRMDDLSVMADAAIAGLGLAWIPSWLVRDQLASGQLVAVMTNRVSLPLETHAVWAADQATPLRLRLAIDTLVEALPRVVPAV